MLSKLSFFKVVRKGVYFLFLFIAFIFKVRKVVGEQDRGVCFSTRVRRKIVF